MVPLQILGDLLLIVEDGRRRIKVHRRPYSEGGPLSFFISSGSLFSIAIS